jgi:predicted RNase H-like HicB family nuclease
VSRQFDVVIERDSEGYQVASVPQMSACHTQARSLDEVAERIREAIELCFGSAAHAGSGIDCQLTAGQLVRIPEA